MMLREQVYVKYVQQVLIHQKVLQHAHNAQPEHTMIRPDKVHHQLVRIVQPDIIQRQEQTTVLSV